MFQIDLFPWANSSLEALVPLSIMNFTVFASTVWSPHQKYQIDKLEAVQRKAARFIKNCWSREQGTVTKLLVDLKWDTLQVRREKARLLMFYKATHGQADIPLPDTLIPLSVRNTRPVPPKEILPYGFEHKEL